MSEKSQEKGTETSEFDKVFVEWEFHDLAGNRIIVKPWSLTKSKKTTKIIGDIYKHMSEEYGASSINFIFKQHPHAFFNDYFDKLCEVLYITVDRDEKWLDHMDISLGLEVLDVIWKQNFTGARVLAQLDKWLQRAPEGESPSNENEPLESLLPGNM